MRIKGVFFWGEFITFMCTTLFFFSFCQHQAIFVEIRLFDLNLYKNMCLFYGNNNKEV
jgi:hypothetical protein